MSCINPFGIVILWLRRGCNFWRHLLLEAFGLDFEELGPKSTYYSICWLDDFLTLASNENRYVGNTMATFVMQSLGCDVAALNTVHFSEPPMFYAFKATFSFFPPGYGEE